VPAASVGIRALLSTTRSPTSSPGHGGRLAASAVPGLAAGVADAAEEQHDEQDDQQ
jgi:hypothetical protein